MKLLYLNLWYGQLFEELKHFLAAVGSDVDVLCFQEVTEETRERCRSLFPRYQEYLAVRGVNLFDTYSLATYVHPDFRVTGVATLLLDQPEAGLVLSLDVENAGKSCTIMNVHGVSRAYQNGQPLVTDEKRDFPVRIKQFETIRDFVQTKGDHVIIGGDFNVLPETASIRMFQEAGYRNLIKEYRIPTTRNALAWKNHPTHYLFSDYVFTGKTIEVQQFSVPDQVTVSDHLPLVLEVA